MPEARVARQVLSYEQEGASYGQEAPPLQKTRSVGAGLVVAQPRNGYKRKHVCVRKVQNSGEARASLHLRSES
jgi:hypothetical protein